MSRRLILAVLALALVSTGSARADDDSYALTIRNNQFDPVEIVIPAGKKISLVVKNLGATPSEFESTELNREKVVGPGGTITVFIGPLRPGSYEFFDDFHPETPHGRIVAK